MLLIFLKIITNFIRIIKILYYTYIFLYININYCKYILVNIFQDYFKIKFRIIYIILYNNKSQRDKNY